jgi:hypothetical protein
VNLDGGQLTFIDTGMVGELNLRQRLHLVGLLYTTTKNDPRALAQSLRSVSEPFRDTNAKAFHDHFVRRVGLSRLSCWPGVPSASGTLVTATVNRDDRGGRGRV